MMALVPIAQPDVTTRAIAACLAGLAPNTQRAYRERIHLYLAWRYSAGLDPPLLTRELVARWAQSLTDSGMKAAGVNQALSAVKRLAQEAANNGWLPWEQAVQIASIQSRKYRGVRSGTWLSAEQIAALLQAPDRESLIGKRDACVLALLIGCGLRRSEAAGLLCDQIRIKPSETGPALYIENMNGKGGRVRSVRVPVWAAIDIQEWMKAAELKSGKLLRSFR